MKIMNKKLKRVLIVVGIVIAVITVGAAIVGLMALNQLKQVVTTPLTPLGLETLPCEPKSQVELGSPYHINGQVAEFTTNGDKLYITAKRFPHSGFSGSWDKSTTLDFGVTDNPPEVDMQRGITTNTIKSVYLSENKYVEVELPAGRYWLLSGLGGDIVIYSCEEGGVSDPKPVWR